MCLFRQKFIPKKLFLLCALGLKPFDAGANPFLLQHEFRGRKHTDPLQVLNGSLAQHIKTADGFHLIPPQFNSIRILLSQVKNIQNTSPDRKLSGTFHLVAFLITHGHQTPACLFFPQSTSPVDFNHVFVPVPHNLWCHQCRICGDDGYWFLLHQPAKSLDPLPNQLISMDIRLKKYQILGRVQYDIPVIKLIFFIKFFGFQIAVCHDHLDPKSFAQPIYHMQLLRVHTAGNGHGSTFSNGSSDIVVIRQFLKRRQ